MHEGRLARAGGPHDRGEASGRKGHRDAGQGVHGRLPLAVAAAQLLGRDDRASVALWRPRLHPRAVYEERPGRYVASSARMHETTPTVHLIARPSLDLDGLRGYLRDVGGESWLERRLEESGGDPNGGELIVEFG